MNIIKGIATLLLLASATLAVATDTPQFTFTVPLDLNNLPPEISNATVECFVYKHDPSTEHTRASTDQPIHGGAFHGDVTVRITVPTLSNPADYDRYNCGLYLGGTAGVFVDSGGARMPLAAGALFRRTTGVQSLPH